MQHIFLQEAFRGPRNLVLVPCCPEHLECKKPLEIGKHCKSMPNAKIIFVPTITHAPASVADNVSVSDHLRNVGHFLKNGHVRSQSNNVVVLYSSMHHIPTHHHSTFMQALEMIQQIVLRARFLEVVTRPDVCTLKMLNIVFCRHNTAEKITTQLAGTQSFAVCLIPHHVDRLSSS